jgi:alpha-tubulin suppressor-like RCC1 family protein
VVAIAAEAYHSLALKADGTVTGWGRTDYGQASTPSGVSNVVAIAAGFADSLALEANGKVVAWGDNTFGQTNIPAGLSNVVAIASGWWHNLALKSNGTVVAWGAGGGSNPYVDYKQTNVPTGLTNVVQIAAGTAHSLALVGTAPPVMQAAIISPSLGTNGFSFSLPTQNGRVYELEFKNSLTDDVWQSLPLKAGTGGLLQWTDSAFAAMRFYRVSRW